MAVGRRGCLHVTSAGDVQERLFEQVGNETRIGAVRAIEEADGSDGPILYGVQRMAAESASGVPIERGQVALTVQVRVVFDLAVQGR